MEFKRIPGATRAMGRDQKEYFTVHIRDQRQTFAMPDGTPFEANSMTLCLEPDPGELELLNQGGQIYVRFLGTQFVPMQMWVEKPEPPEGFPEVSEKLEAAARRLAAFKLAHADPLGLDLPDGLWRDYIPDALAAIGYVE